MQLVTAEKPLQLRGERLQGRIRNDRFLPSNPPTSLRRNSVAHTGAARNLTMPRWSATIVGNWSLSRETALVEAGDDRFRRV